MCGKFTQAANEAEAVSLAAGVPEGPEDTVTPMRFAGVIRRGAGGGREAVRMRWGFVPADAPDQALVATKFIHARAETIDQKPTFREAFLRRRGLVVTCSFNEGKEITAKKTEQYVVTARTRRRLAIAVIWERWKGPGPVPLETFAMVTVPPNALIATITDRMPAVIDDADWGKWLGEEPATVDELKRILRPSEIAMDMQKAGKPAPPPRPNPQPDLF
ncbi:MAG TPA: SOS response-associated peptidase [Rhizomicrobium sp.]|jgi:putative SOS response-associated peptidase YedK|nr:SOS response-associated peptidase [Rhizomicrobium sp.]